MWIVINVKTLELFLYEDFNRAITDVFNESSKIYELYRSDDDNFKLQKLNKLDSDCICNDGRSLIWEIKFVGGIMFRIEYHDLSW